MSDIMNVQAQLAEVKKLEWACKQIESLLARVANLESLLRAAGIEDKR